jgi:SAM-dependent methyltransferase
LPGDRLHPEYPIWIRSRRIRAFWLVGGAIIALAAVVGLFWPPGFALAIFALPALYIAVVLTWASRRLGPEGDDVQGRVHQLLIDSVGSGGRLLDIGCGSGQLLIRFAKAAPGEYVGLDHWGDDWEYSQGQAERNARLEGVEATFVRGSASRLPFADAEFGRVVSSLTFHEVQEVTDKTESVTEALRVLEPGGRFAFIDVFDDPSVYPGRETVLHAIERAGGVVESATTLSELIELRFPLNLGRVLKHAVLVNGAKAI